MEGSFQVSTTTFRYTTSIEGGIGAAKGGCFGFMGRFLVYPLRRTRTPIARKTGGTFHWYDDSFQLPVLQVDRDPEIFHLAVKLSRLEELLGVEHPALQRR
jgi:hypothetical protein